MKFVLDHFVQDAPILGLAVAFFVWILRKHLSAYLGEKGKLKAQVEDIQKVTRLTEEARMEFIERTAFLEQKGTQAATKEDVEHITRQIESVKLELSKKATTHRLRMEKEFAVLSEAWDTLKELRNATEGLFPLGLQPRLEGQEQQNELSRRHVAFNKAFVGYLDAIEKNKPFIPREIRDSLFEIEKKAKEVEVNFKYGIDDTTGKLKDHSYQASRPLLASLAALAENVSHQINDQLNG